MKNDVNVPSKSNKQKNFVLKIIFYVVGFLKVNDENSRGMDPQIYIRIKMSWIRNTADVDDISGLLGTMTRKKGLSHISFLKVNGGFQGSVDCAGVRMSSVGAAGLSGVPSHPRHLWPQKGAYIILEL